MENGGRQRERMFNSRDPQKELETWLRDAAQRMSQREIARALGVSVGTVNARLRALGITPRTHGARLVKGVRLTILEVRAIRRMRVEGWTHAALAKEFHTSRRTIGLIVNGKTWKDDK